MDKHMFRFRANFHPVESLERLRQNPTQENERGFLAEIKNARLLVLCAPKGGQADKECLPTILHTQAGERFLAAFSNLPELEKWPFVRGETRIFSFDDLKHTMLEHPQNLAGIVINPFGKMLLLRQNQIQQIDAATRGMSVQRVKHDEGLRLLPPREIPPGLVDGVKDFLRRRRDIYRVYLLWARGPGESVPHWLFLIDFEGTEAGLFPQVAELVQPYMKSGGSFELMKANPGLLKVAAAINEPIYQRKSH